MGGGIGRECDEVSTLKKQPLNTEGEHVGNALTRAACSAATQTIGPLYNNSMLFLTRRRLLIASPLVVLFLVAVAVYFLTLEQDLRSRSVQISIGMPREQVENILGPPVMTLPRTVGKGAALIWVDEFWQVSVRTGPEGLVETVDCMPSDSLYRRTLGRLTGLPK